MKIKLIILCLILNIVNIFAGHDDFVRELPGKDLVNLITREKFPTMDAIIILKEQSFKISKTKIDYEGVTLTGPQTVTTNILIVKLLDEAAVKKYGSFEYSYREKFGDEIPNGFEARARVLKADGSIFTLDEDEFHNIVLGKDSHGTPLMRKAYFKIPDLAPGDVVQIEYQFNNVFSRSYSGIFYYNDSEYTLFSNLYITLPADEEFNIVSLPKEKIGEPQIQQFSNEFGTGKTYFWGLKNLNEIPDEVYSLPFDDRSMITGFIVSQTKKYRKYDDNWIDLGSDFYNDYIDDGEVDDDDLMKLGYDIDSMPVFNSNQVDSLYTSIRRYFQLYSINSLYPATDDISDKFETKKADASDCSFIMYKILKEQGVDCKCIMIRDKREGVYEQTIPSTLWFDRLGLLVKINNEEKLYDFDKCISTSYSNPWYLNDINVFVIDKSKSYHKKVSFASDVNDNFESESHSLNFDKNFNLNDDLHLQYKGSFAENLRGALADMGKSDIREYFEHLINSSCLTKIDSFNINNFTDENNVNVTSSGLSTARAEVVDSFIVVNLKNLFLKKFRDKIFTPLRKTDMVFDSKFKFNMNYTVEIPEHYGLYSKCEKHKITGPDFCSSEMTYSINPNSLRIDFNILFPTSFIRVNDYPSLMNFIEESLGQIGGDIIFKKDNTIVSGN
jgi:Domain of Unknown Function with PDB structure (DUF3857)